MLGICTSLPRSPEARKLPAGAYGTGEMTHPHARTGHLQGMVQRPGLAEHDSDDDNNSDDDVDDDDDEVDDDDDDDDDDGSFVWRNLWLSGGPARRVHRTSQPVLGRSNTGCHP